MCGFFIPPAIAICRKCVALAGGERKPLRSNNQRSNQYIASFITVLLVGDGGNDKTLMNMRIWQPLFSARTRESQEDVLVSDILNVYIGRVIAEYETQEELYKQLTK